VAKRSAGMVPSPLPSVSSAPFTFLSFFLLPFPLLPPFIPLPYFSFPSFPPFMSVRLYTCMHCGPHWPFVIPVWYLSDNKWRCAFSQYEEVPLWRTFPCRRTSSIALRIIFVRQKMPRTRTAVFCTRQQCTECYVYYLNIFRRIKLHYISCELNGVL